MVVISGWWWLCTDEGDGFHLAWETLGEWREKVAGGEEFMETTSYFMAGLRLFTPRTYRNLWKAWGLSERPANFDDEVLKRYGLFAADFNNPYPLEGEDPSLTNGGSGQLPMGLTMVKNLENPQLVEPRLDDAPLPWPAVLRQRAFYHGTGAHVENVDAFMNSLSPPLFHKRDLWSGDGNAHAPKPGQTLAPAVNRTCSTGAECRAGWPTPWGINSGSLIKLCNP